MRWTARICLDGCRRAGNSLSAYTVPDDDVVDEMPVLTARVNPRRPITGREAEDRVGDEQFMLCASLEQQKTIAVAVAASISTTDPIPAHVVRAHPCTRVIEYDELVGFRNSCNDRVAMTRLQFFEELGHVFQVCHGWSVGAEDGDVLPPPPQTRGGISWP